MDRARQTVPSPEDGLLTQLYRQVTEQQVARFSGGYDLAAGRDRYAAWLRDGAAGAGDWDADQAVTALYGQHYRGLVRLAALLVRDVTVAEDVVQDSFVALHSAWPQLRGPDDAAAFLRRSVVQGSRSRLRSTRADMAAKAGGPARADAPAAGRQAGESAVVTAVRALPARQREALVLRCYADLADEQIGSAIGISAAGASGLVNSAMAALRPVLQPGSGALQTGQGEPC